VGVEVQLKTFLKFDVPAFAFLEKKSFGTHSKRDRKDLGEGLDVAGKGKAVFIRVLQWV